jgi:hypothetical protein
MTHQAALTLSLPVIVALGVAVSDAHADDCALLPRQEMRIRLTVPDAYTQAGPTIKSIVSSTWEREGIRLSWREGTVQPDAWSGVDVWIAAIPGMPVKREGGVLAELLFNAGTPRRLIRLSVDAVTAWVLPRSAWWLHTTPGTLVRQGWDPSQRVPRALGRVAAHELGHFLLGSPAHAPAGLMRASYDRPGHLVDRSGTFTLDSSNRERLRERLVDSAQCR